MPTKGTAKASNNESRVPGRLAAPFSPMNLLKIINRNG
jgi:hypothetical protein